jgi:O-acetylhomoserine/O-acetylserine sulfhydrylase-like pyridoxal-dependent enzyme
LAAAITYRTEKLFERRSKSMWLGLAAITLASGFSALAVTIQEV